MFAAVLADPVSAIEIARRCQRHRHAVCLLVQDAEPPCDASVTDDVGPVGMHFLRKVPDPSLRGPLSIHVSPDRFDTLPTSPDSNRDAAPIRQTPEFPNVTSGPERDPDGACQENRCAASVAESPFGVRGSDRL
jgi:hypothetical protein